MTKVSFREYREAFGKRITIWGGVPSNLMLKNCCSEEHFRQFVGELIQDAKPYNNLILSVADTMPPDADVGRIRHLVDECRKTFDGYEYP
jgi:uroporphyrinogen-III decarboxylase